MNVRGIALAIAAALMMGVFAFAAPAKSQGTQAIQIIDGPRVEGTGDTWAVVAWTTNAGGSSIVHYGTNQGSLTQTAEEPYQGAKVHSGKVTHRVRINNLQPNTTYYFQVDSGQGSGTGTESKSGIMNFQTKGQGQSAGMSGSNQGVQQVQIVDGPRIEGTGDTWARIAWTTNAGASSIVRYGTDPNNLTQTAESPYAGEKIHQGRVTHRVEVRNLQPNTTYYYMVDSGQGSGTGTQTQSSVQTFQTVGSGQASAPTSYSQTYNQTYGGNPNQQPYGANPNQQPYGGSPYGTSGPVQIVDGPRLEGLTSNSATISWTTVGSGSSIIHFGNNPSSLTQTAQGSAVGAGASGQFVHRVTLNGLQSHTTYYFVVDSGQGGYQGPRSQSSVLPFTTR